MNSRDRQTFHDTQKNLKSFLLPFADETFEWLSIEDISSQLSHSVIFERWHCNCKSIYCTARFIADRDWVAQVCLNANV